MELSPFAGCSIYPAPEEHQDHLRRTCGASGSTNPVVSLKDGRVVATSKDVSAYFGKQHNNVLAAIDNLIGISVEAALNFKFCPCQAYEQGRSYRQFEMTRDGFTLLAMGFTGKKALQFKLA